MHLLSISCFIDCQVYAMFSSIFLFSASGDRVYEDDEIIIEFAISNQVFSFLAQSVVPMEKFHKEVGCIMRKPAFYTPRKTKF